MSTDSNSQIPDDVEKVLDKRVRLIVVRLDIIFLFHGRGLGLVTDCGLWLLGCGSEE